MQTAILSYGAPTCAARETWKNGVVHSDDGPTDIYELPTNVPGVAQRIELRPVLWGLMGNTVTVTDCQGNHLEGERNWDKQLVARDPRSGLETVLDPKSRNLTVTTPTVREKTETGTNTFHESYHREAHQEVDRDGNCRLQTNLHGESESVKYSMVREMPANQTMVTRNDRTWEETRIAKGQAPVSQSIKAEKHSRQEGAGLSATLEPDGKLAIVGEDGVSRSYEMFLRV